MPMNLEIIIPSDEAVRLLSAVTDVWKTAVTKKQLKLGEKIASELPKLLEASGTGVRLPHQVTVRRLKKLRKQLYAAKEAHNLVFVRGKGYHD